jgi:hypothetical protein
MNQTLKLTLLVGNFRHRNLQNFILGNAFLLKWRIGHLIS